MLSDTGSWLAVGSGLRIVTFSTVSVVEVAGGLGTLAAGAETAASLGVRGTCLDEGGRAAGGSGLMAVLSAATGTLPFARFRNELE